MKIHKGQSGPYGDSWCGKFTRTTSINKKVTCKSCLKKMNKKLKKPYPIDKRNSAPKVYVDARYLEALEKVYAGAKKYEDIQTEAWHELEDSLRELEKLKKGE